MSKALKNINNHVTKQTSQARPEQVQNNAGGFVFSITPKSRLERFLIIGTDGGTFYVGEQKLTVENTQFLQKLIETDETLVRETMLDVAKNNRALRVSPTIFTAAMLHIYGTDKVATREALPAVLRTSTHLFEYAQYIKNLAGWGRSKVSAVANWYTSKDDNELGYQLVKYRQRNGWEHKDLLRLSHPKISPALAEFTLGKPVTDASALPEIVQGYQKVSTATSAKEVIAVLNEYKNLPWETVPTEFHKNVDVWKTLFHNGSLKGTALLRNVTRLARLEAFDDMDFAAEYAAAIRNPENIAKSRLHPINYLNASVVHTDGQIDRQQSNGWSYSGQRVKNWRTNSAIASAIEDAFNTSFGFLEPANKRTLLALDISGSMSQTALGLDLSCAQVSAAMAMSILRSEPKSLVLGFSTKFVDLDITATDSLSQVMKKIQNRNFGSTDCSLPMVWAKENNVQVDTFAVFTDNETYAGRIHPYQALVQYRKATGIDAREAVFGVAGTNFTIADPKDAGMMDFVGFDAAAPRVFADFSAGRI